MRKCAIQIKIEIMGLRMGSEEQQSFVKNNENATDAINHQHQVVRRTSMIGHVVLWWAIGGSEL